MKYCRQMFNGKSFKRDEVVAFFHEYEKHGVFSQWFIQYFTEDGVEFNCMEQYMMYHKAKLFNDTITANKILRTENPSQIKKLGREVSNFDDHKWDKLKSEIVVTGNSLKFAQSDSAGEELRRTGDALLVEASPYDKVWGIGMDKRNPSIYMPKCWRGQNLLGFALMEVRDLLFGDMVKAEE